MSEDEERQSILELTEKCYEMARLLKSRDIGLDVEAHAKSLRDEVKELLMRDMQNSRALAPINKK